MVQRTPDQRVRFKPRRTRGLLGNMDLFPEADITNPREMYSMLSGSRPQKSLLPVLTPRLSPLMGSSQVWPLSHQSQHHHHSSMQDLSSTTKGREDLPDSQPQIPRSSSLQDLSFQAETRDNSSNKLKPILKSRMPTQRQDHEDNSRSDPDRETGSEGHSNFKNAETDPNNGKGTVKFGVQEIHLIKHSPLPPVRGAASHNVCNQTLDAGIDSDQNFSHENLLLHPRFRRNNGLELRHDIFPHGRPVRVRRPATPTYDDYPQTYWELRSTSVQEPSDLKEAMIDRDHYRLQQISSLQLRAMKRDIAASRTDMYSKWQRKQADGAVKVAESVASESGERVLNSKTGTGKVTKIKSPPAHNSFLLVEARSINSVKDAAAVENETESREDAPEHSDFKPGKEVVGEPESHNPSNHSTTKAAKETKQKGIKTITPKVVNLNMGPHHGTTLPVQYVDGSKSVRPASQNSEEQDTKSQGNSQLQQTAMIEDPSHIPNAIIVTPSAVQRSSCSRSISSSSQSHRSVTGSISPSEGKGSQKFILKKFNRLQVFNEKAAPKSASSDDGFSLESPVVPAKVVDKNKPYMPQNRPRIYKMDTRCYPLSLSAGLGNGMTGDNFSPLVDMGAISSRDKPEVSSLHFRFSNGEVIVSRQGKRP